jgi:hypothetical protein
VLEQAAIIGYVYRAELGQGELNNMKKCLTVVLGIVALVLFAPMASAAYITCQSTSGSVAGGAGTYLIPATQLQCNSITIPTGTTLFQADIRFEQDASGALDTGVPTVIEWDWTLLSVTGGGGSISGVQYTQESSDGNSISLGNCTIVSATFANDHGCNPTIINIPLNGTIGIVGGPGVTFGPTDITVSARIISGPGMEPSGAIANAYLKIQYDSTPEPATFGLIGSALLALGVFGSKKLSRR